MRYVFPLIKNLDDVRPAIEGRDEFIIAERDWGYVVNYMVNMADTFPPVDESPELEDDLLAQRNAIRRECRGMIFCPNTKRIVRRPLTKFFNVAERDETQLHRLDFSQNHKVYTKMDGSMVAPFEVGHGSGIIRWGTKMGLSEQAIAAEAFVARNPHYQDFAKWCIQNDITPIFEYTSPTNRIVLKYNEEKLTLLAARHMITGQYLDVCL